MPESLSLGLAGIGLMIDLNVEFDKSKYESLMKKLELMENERAINNAISKGAKKAADEAKKETITQILSGYTVSGAEIKSAIKTRKMGGSETGAVMKIESGTIPLYQFEGVSPREVMPPAKGPVRAAVKQGGGSELGRVFVAKMPSGHIGVYEREENKRKSKDSHGMTSDKIKRNGKLVKNTEKYHINELFGPSIAGMFGREKETEINIAVREKAMENLDKHVINELERLLNG
jgi:hypothetical protein